MEKATIIYIHIGYSFYLLPNLLHTRKQCPNARIILIGDKANQKIANFGFEHYIIEDYKESADAFAKVYFHRSPNSYEFELFCFQRWFIIYDIVEKLGIEQFLVCDTDAFLFCDVQVEFMKYSDSDFTITRNGTPCFTYFTKYNLRRFTDYILRCYTSEEGRRRIENYYQYLVDGHKKYGISDMSAFVAIEHLDGAKPMHLDCVTDGNAYDHNYIDANDGFKMIHGHKLTVWHDGQPYQFLNDSDKPILIKGIHMQGKAKFMLHQILPIKYLLPVWHVYLKELIKMKLRTLKHKIKR